MKSYQKTLWLFLFLCPRLLLCQENPHALVQKAIRFVRQEEFDAAINLGRRITGSGELSGIELGRAYLILGVAYREEGKFVDAQQAFDQSVRILKAESKDVADYASALDNYGGLYNETGQFEAARAMWKKALELRRQLGDHAAVMLSLTDLTQLALTEKRLREANRYWREVSDERRRANDLTADDNILFYETQGWLALSSGHASEAVVSYQRAFELCKQTRGEQHWISGWDRMLLGKALAKDGDIGRGLNEMRDGLRILDLALGRNNPKFWKAEIAYSELLDRSGAHEEAARLRKTAAKAIQDLDGTQRADHTVNVLGLR